MLAHAAVDRLSAFNRRTLDPLAARIYSYLSLCHEVGGARARRCWLPQPRASRSIRAERHAPRATALPSQDPLSRIFL